MTLKDYVFQGNREDEQAYRQIIETMLNGMAAHAVQGEPAAYQQFRADLQRFSGVLASDAKPGDLVVKAADLVKVLENYGRATNELVRQRNAELHEMVSMLAETVINIGSNSDASTARLREVEKTLVRLGLAGDIQVLKTQLAECLDTIRDEAQRRKADSEQAMARLEQDLDASRQPHDIDSITGLPGKREAESALRLAVASPEGKFILIAVVSRVYAVNARFGYAAGDQILAVCAEHFRSGLTPPDQLYRWQGPAFLGIIARDRRIDQVRSEIRRFADASVQQTFQLGNRDVPIQVSTNWSIMQASPPLEVVQKKIEAFTAAQIPRDYA